MENGSEKSKSDIPGPENVDLKPEQVRWFYREDNAKEWTPFIGYDSLRIETKFRELKLSAASSLEDLENTFKNPEQEDFNPIEMVLVRGGLFEVNVEARKCYPIYWNDHIDPKNGTNLTEVGDQSATVLRGSWFRDLGNGSVEPLEDETMADDLENTHFNYFMESPIRRYDESLSTDQTKSSDPKTLLSKNFQDCHVEWLSYDQIWMYQETTGLYIRQKLGMGKAGIRLLRGYPALADMDDKPPDITHLCFIIHGIGQKVATGAIVKACSKLRKLTHKVQQRYFPDLTKNNQRVEFLPVEWRSSLQLDNGVVETITPVGLTNIRYILNGAAMDIMYYTSPIYRYEIIQALRFELTRLYSMFCARHPYFESSGGKVSIAAHSLGCVISYDLLTGWCDSIGSLCDVVLNKETQMNNEYCSISKENEDAKSAQEHERVVLGSKIEATKELLACLEGQFETLSSPKEEENPKANMKLLFGRKLSNFFCFGSPLPVFLALRGIRPSKSHNYEHILPSRICEKFFNVFHPTDPIAYRMEPLIMKQYCMVQPLQIHKIDQIAKSPYNSMPPVMLKDKLPVKQFKVPDYNKTEDLTNNPKYSRSLTDMVYSIFSSRNSVAKNLDCVKSDSLENVGKPEMEKPSSEFPDDEGKGFQNLFDEVSESEKTWFDDLDSYSSSNIPKIQNRVDYQLMGNRYESVYIAALTSHFGYWTNPDVVLFILTQMFNEYGPVGIPAKTK